MGSKGIAQRIAASPTKDTKVKEWRYGRITSKPEIIRVRTVVAPDLRPQTGKVLAPK